MTTVINGSSPSITFSDSTTQTTAFTTTPSVTTITTSADASISGLTVGKGNNGLGSSTAVGYQALFNQTGNLNTSLGYKAGYNITSGTENISIGYLAGAYTNAGTGTANINIGNATGATLSSGATNTTVGHNAFNLNTTGSNNVALGGFALQANTTASNNTAVGYQAGYANTTSSYNTFIGNLAGNSTTSAQNTFVGQGAGQLVSSGAKNTIIGGYNGNLGGLDIRTSSNNVVLSDGDGNIAARWANGGGWYQLNNSVSWSITSDARIKKNVISLESGIDVISALRPVEFDYIENDKHDIGFIAQEYQTVLPSQISEGKDGMLSLNQNLVPYLVKAIQELNAKVTALEAQLGAK